MLKQIYLHFFNLNSPCNNLSDRSIPYSQIDDVLIYNHISNKITKYYDHVRQLNPNAIHILLIILKPTLNISIILKK